jgi:hypothetical protein
VTSSRIRKPSVSKRILEILHSEGTVRKEHTGCVLIELHLNQGGVTDAKVNVSEKLK